MVVGCTAGANPLWVASIKSSRVLIDFSRMGFVRYAVRLPEYIADGKRITQS